MDDMETPTPDTIILNSDEVAECWQARKITSGTALSDEGNFALAMVVEAAKVPEETRGMPHELRKQFAESSPPEYQLISLIVEDPFTLVALWHSIGYQIFTEEAWQRIFAATLTED